MNHCWHLPSSIRPPFYCQIKGCEQSCCKETPKSILLLNIHSVAHTSTVTAVLSRDQHADTAPGNLAGSSWAGMEGPGCSCCFPFLCNLHQPQTRQTLLSSLAKLLLLSPSPSIFSDSPSHPFSSSKTQFFHSRCLHRFWLREKCNVFNLIWMVFPELWPVEVTALQAVSMWLLSTWPWPASLWSLRNVTSAVR